MKRVGQVWCDDLPDDDPKLESFFTALLLALGEYPALNHSHAEAQAYDKEFARFYAAWCGAVTESEPELRSSVLIQYLVWCARNTRD